MTGFGEASVQRSHTTVLAVARTVNNRHLKVSVRGTEPYSLQEAEFERVARKILKRGTLHLNIRVERQAVPDDLRINTTAIRSYLTQLQNEVPEVRSSPDLAPIIANLLEFPGVVPDGLLSMTTPDGEWEIVEEAVTVALRKLHATRQTEGQAMANELLSLQNRIRECLVQIQSLAPNVIASYRTRIHERVRQVLADFGSSIEPEQLIREVSLYADRTDISEEITRLDAHMVQFQDVIQKESDSPGRRLEFILQEMGRETNTLGSKAGDVAISRQVVEIKATIEKMKELVQNIE